MVFGILITTSLNAGLVYLTSALNKQLEKRSKMPQVCLSRTFTEVPCLSTKVLELLDIKVFMNRKTKKLPRNIFNTKDCHGKVKLSS